MIDHACRSAGAAGAAAAQNEEQSWEQASKRAEHVRQQAGRSPETDTRTLGKSS